MFELPSASCKCTLGINPISEIVYWQPVPVGSYPIELQLLFSEDAPENCRAGVRRESKHHWPDT
jgi:hypothetical protein